MRNRVCNARQQHGILTPQRREKRLALANSGGSSGNATRMGRFATVVAAGDLRVAVMVIAKSGQNKQFAALDAMVLSF